MKLVSPDISKTTLQPSNVSELSARDVEGWVAGVAVVTVLAVTGNCILLSAVWRTPHLRTLTNIFTINLALTDLGVALIVLPVWMSSIIHSSFTSNPAFSFDACQCIAFLTVLLLLVSIATLSGISFDRYLCICHPLQYPRRVTSRRVNAALTYIWLQSSVLASLPLWGWGQYVWRPQSLPICGPAWSSSIGLSALVLTLGVFLPFSLMVFSYVRIVQEARRQYKRIQQIQLTLVVPIESTEDEPEEKATVMELQRRPSLLKRIAKRTSIVQSPIKNSYAMLARNLKMLKIVFVVVGAFVICWGPYLVTSTWVVHLNSLNPSYTMPVKIEYATTILAFSSCAINPFVFISLTRDFRLAVRMLLCHILKLLPCMSRWAIAQTRRMSQANSVIESVRLQSRGSYDSGVEMESPYRRMSQMSQTSTVKMDDEIDHPWSSQTRTSIGSGRRFLGEDLPTYPQIEMQPSKKDLDSPGEQITISVPTTVNVNANQCCVTIGNADDNKML